MLERWFRRALGWCWLRTSPLQCRSEPEKQQNLAGPWEQPCPSHHKGVTAPPAGPPQPLDTNHFSSPSYSFLWSFPTFLCLNYPTRVVGNFPWIYYHERETSSLVEDSVCAQGLFSHSSGSLSVIGENNSHWDGVTIFFFFSFFSLEVSIFIVLSLWAPQKLLPAFYLWSSVWISKRI